jgi:vacuolar-type H+-ATPase subunit I/STV1
MKRLAVFFLLCVVTASGRGDDALVNASKEAKAKRKKSTTKVITNKDVRKSKGTLIENGVPLAPLPPAQPSLSEQYAAEQQLQTLNAARIATLKNEIARLEKELAAIEQSYYDENDLKKRDTEIVARFAETRKKLDETNAALTVLQGRTPAPPPAEPATAPKNPPG